MTALPVSLSFEGVTLSIVDHEGKPWLSAADFARALGYKESDAVSRIYRRNKDEFSSGMTETVKLTVSGENSELQNETRIFSPRGCLLIAMFSKTAKAKAFRKWVLDVLDGLSFREAPRQEPVTNAQLQELSRKVWLISSSMTYRRSVEWNCWKRLHETFDVSPISALPAARFDDALAILTQMEAQAGRFKEKVREVEQRFCKEVLRMGGDFDTLEKRLEQLH